MHTSTKVFFTAILAVFATACHAQSPAKSPADTAKAFVLAVWQGDKETAQTLVTKGSQLTGFPAKGKEGVAEPKVISEDVNADRATVVLELGERGRESLPMIKEEGVWKVDSKAMRSAKVADAQKLRAEADFQNIATVLKMYQQLNGTYPSSEQGISALVERPKSEPLPKKWRMLMAELPRDVWGTPYGYKHPAVRSKKDFDVYSLGPDRIDGTADDIGNW